jgi:hypothetical protein
MSQEIVWEIPENLYREIAWAQQELKFPNMVDFIGQAVQRRLEEIKYEAWQRDFRKLQKQIHASGGFGLGETKEEVITNLRTIRHQIFEEEYADLYR